MHSLGIVQWNSTRRDHPGNPRRVSGSGLEYGSMWPFYSCIGLIICDTSILQVDGGQWDTLGLGASHILFV